MWGFIKLYIEAKSWAYKLEPNRHLAYSSLFGNCLSCTLKSMDTSK